MLKIDVVIFTHNAMRGEIIKKKKSLHHIDARPRAELIYALIDAPFDPFYAGIGDDRRPCLLRGREIGKIIERETRGIILYSGLTSWQLRTWRRVVGAGCGTWRGWTECRSIVEIFVSPLA